MPLRLHNSLSRRVEPLIPIDPRRVTFYSCGPTVYDDAHIGNFRSCLAADVLRRWIESPLCELENDPPRKGGRRVVHVMNITDVGHMTDDAEGGESGEDRMAVAGRRLREAKKQGTVGAEAIHRTPNRSGGISNRRSRRIPGNRGRRLVWRRIRTPRSPRG